MIDLLAIAPIVAPALGGAAALSKAGAIATGLTKAALTGYTAYEGAKMIPYFTDPSTVRKDLLRKQRDEFSDERELWWLDRFRANMSGIADLDGDGEVKNSELNQYLDKEAQGVAANQSNRIIAKNKRKVKEKEAELSDYDLRMRDLKENVLNAELEGFADAANIRQEELGLQKQKLLSNSQNELARINALIAGDAGTNSVAMAEIGLRQQAADIARQERYQDKAAERRQAIFMALMALMS